MCKCSDPVLVVYENRKKEVIKFWACSCDLIHRWPNWGRGLKLRAGMGD